MKIYVTSIMVDSQEKACQFYTEKLGFKVKHDVPVSKQIGALVCENGFKKIAIW